MSYKSKKISVIIAAAGMGKRMNSNINKQYILLNDKPILFYTLYKFEKNEFVDDIIIVAKEDEISYCNKNIVSKYGFKKVKDIVAGGKERRDSVYNGLNAIDVESDIVLIHDGARPFVDNEIINSSIKEVIVNKATVVGVPVKDTIKIVSDDNIVESTPNRSHLWKVQTPQSFSYSVIMDCYNKGIENDLNVTDDSMLVEHFGYSVKMIMGSYKNIKITTPEDLVMGKNFLE
ncbi:2-C-methyl-D-erythritol 4-phosphate cytidylyltransferase [Senegalia massiliensis]|uniref:2-C-methyl-D-erythritol 4-phosphate cytidylyltransferase n=1 Tax=Senegalia massiliensis TaxID=1720316 RepID=A0A845R373_9CLOT|nr:2-C-methyl-D-erythritol 4-phosphate cytidylyltransferase [Senegalia massiliensis]NBI08038.1 2-C-methyl-D-erythritol 4-phosphate cytidylyltransferase [Senegalia massiliensis]